MDLSKLPKLSGRSGQGEDKPATEPALSPGSMMTAADLAQFAADSAQSAAVEPVAAATSVPAAIPVAVAAPPTVGPAVPVVPVQSPPTTNAGTPANPYDLGRIGFVETWMSVGIGIFVLLLMPRFMQWVSWKLFNTQFNQFVIKTDDAEVIVPYTKVPEFWSDLGPTLLGAVLIVDGLLFLTKRKTAIAIALVITFGSTAYNLWYVVHSERGDAVTAPSLPIYSALAVLFGGMMLATQWMAFKSFPPKQTRVAVPV